MPKTTITAPVEGYSGVGAGGLVFADGVAETDNDAVIDYCRTAGYGVGSAAPKRGKQVKQTDARDVDTTVVGAALRDAAVDPQAADFLPPTNAGKADPHGPLVVAPGIHGVETQVVRPGQVYVEDLAAQEKAETDQAMALLVKNQPVGEAVATFIREEVDADGEVLVEGSDTGPLGLSDPGSVVAGDTGNSADTEAATLPDGTSTEPPAASASKGAWTAYARAQGATDADLDGKTRDQLRDAYSPASTA